MPQSQHQGRQRYTCEVAPAHPGLAELVEFGVELRPGALGNPPLQQAQDMGVGLAILPTMTRLGLILPFE